MESGLEGRNNVDRQEAGMTWGDGSQWSPA